MGLRAVLGPRALLGILETLGTRAGEVQWELQGTSEQQVISARPEYKVRWAIPGIPGHSVIRVQSEQRVSAAGPDLRETPVIRDSTVLSAIREYRVRSASLGLSVLRGSEEVSASGAWPGVPDHRADLAYQDQSTEF